MKPLKLKKTFYENELENGMEILKKIYEDDRKKEIDALKRKENA